MMCSNFPQNFPSKTTPNCPKIRSSISQQRWWPRWSGCWRIESRCWSVSKGISTAFWWCLWSEKRSGSKSNHSRGKIGSLRKIGWWVRRKLGTTLMNFTTNNDGDLDFMALRQWFLNFSVRDERYIVFYCVTKILYAWIMGFQCVTEILKKVPM